MPTACAVIIRCASRISSSRRGEVAPFISGIRSLIWSASSAIPVGLNMPAWALSTSARPAGASTRPMSKASGTVWMTIRSRIRSSRSTTKRRGSMPLSMTSSTVENNRAPSPAARASTVASRSVKSVRPSNGCTFS